MKSNKLLASLFIGSMALGCWTVQAQDWPNLNRFREANAQLAAPAKGEKREPEAVVILAGTNDIAGNTGPSTLKMIMDNLKAMAEIAEANDIEVILCSVLPVKRYSWRPEVEATQQVVDLNKMIKEYCQQKKIIYLDYFSAMATPENFMIPEYTTDEVHVTPKGYDLMEQMVQEAIKKAL